MRGPDGEASSINGCYLEVIENKRLVWTDTLQEGFRPAEAPFITAVISFEPHGKGTKQVSYAMHKDPATRKDHEDKGFYDGWGACMDQLAEFVKGWQ